MITYTSGNLLDADVDAVVNTVNTVGVMGKGLALQFKRRYPDNYEAYRKGCKMGNVNLGHMFVTETGEIHGPRLIVNFPTKGHWKTNSRLDDIRRGLQDLVRVIRERGITSIAVPPLGAGNGGLDWQDVRPLIAEVLAPLDDVRIEIYEPVKTHFAVAAGRPQKLTQSRRLVIELLLAYSRQKQAVEPWEDDRGASHLEIQKLLYFAEQALPDQDFDFKRGKYGPYSEKVRLIVQELEGTYLEGYGDGNDPVLSLAPIKVTDEAIKSLTTIDPRVDAAAVEGVVRKVIEYVHGFEGAYPLELLSSVKWAVDDTGSHELEKITEYIRGWNYRKGQLFTPHHIDTALTRVAAG